MAEPAFYSTTDLRAILCKAPGLPRSPVRVPSLRASRPFLHPCVRVWPWSRPCPVRSPMFPLCSPGGRTANPRRSRFACGRGPRRRESVRARVTGGAAPPRASACSCFRTITCCLQSISDENSVCHADSFLLSPSIAVSAVSRGSVFIVQHKFYCCCNMRVLTVITLRMIPKCYQQAC